MRGMRVTNLVKAAPTRRRDAGIDGVGVNSNEELSG